MIDARPDTPHPDAPEAPAVDPLLTAFLAEGDARCPRCGYQLRGLAGNACPECGQNIELVVGPVHPGLGWWLGAVVCWSAAVAVNGVIAAGVNIRVLLVRDAGGSLGVIILLGPPAVIGIVVLIRLLLARPRLRMPVGRPFGWLAAAGCFTAVVPFATVLLLLSA